MDLHDIYCCACYNSVYLVSKRIFDLQTTATAESKRNYLIQLFQRLIEA